MVEFGLSGAFVFLGYVVYGLTGFGASVVAIPLIAQILPLKLAVPMMLLMDIAAGFFVGLRNKREIARPELTAVVPWVALGMVLGVTFLINMPEQTLLLILGIFATFQSIKNLFFKPSHSPLGSNWRVFFGTVGGLFTSLYGVGGTIYAIYFGHRIPTESQRRATLAFLIWLTGLGRLVLFLIAGLLIQDELPVLAAICLPLCLLGVYCGSQLRKRLHLHHLNKAVWVIVGIAGLSLLARTYKIL